VDRDGIAPPSAGLQPAALLPKLPILKIGADGEPRTHNLLFTRQLLCQIELHQQYRRGRRVRARPGLSAIAFPHERLCPNVYTIHIVKERPTGHKKTPVGVNRPGSLVGASLEGSLSSLPRNVLRKAKSSLPHYSWRASHNGQTQHAPVCRSYRTGVRLRPH